MCTFNDFDLIEMQNIFRELAWRMLCFVDIILNKIHETLFFHQSAT